MADNKTPIDEDDYDPPFRLQASEIAQASEMPITGLLSLTTPAGVVSFWIDEESADTLSKQLHAFLCGESASMVLEFVAAEAKDKLRDGKKKTQGTTRRRPVRD